MAVFAAIAFAASFLENDHFFTFHEGTFNLANYFCTFYGGCANLHCAVSVYQENTVKLNGFTLFLVVAEVVDIQELAGFGLELLSLNFYDNVHLLIFTVVTPAGEDPIGGSCFFYARGGKLRMQSYENFLKLSLFTSFF